MLARVLTFFIRSLPKAVWFIVRDRPAPPLNSLRTALFGHGVSFVRAPDSFLSFSLTSAVFSPRAVASRGLVPVFFSPSFLICVADLSGRKPKPLPTLLPLFPDRVPPPTLAFREDDRDDFGDTSDSDEDDTSGMKLPWVTSPLGATRPNHRGGTENGNKIVPSGSDSSDDERVDETRLGVIEKRTTSHYGRTISVWSPGIRGRAARTREVLAVARNAREQAKENEFLRQRLRELENDSGTYEEKRRLYQNESRKTHTTLRQREIVLLAECAAHEASATQLEKELDRMRAIEEQSAVEAMHLIRKMSRLQTELAAGNRRAHIAEEMLMGFQNEGERAAADADKWRLEAERVETDTARQTELENSYGKAMKVRGFPIYHIPPTDCPRETDISFLQSGTRRVARRKRADARGYPRAARRDGGAATRGDGDGDEFRDGNSGSCGYRGRRTFRDAGGGGSVHARGVARQGVAHRAVRVAERM